MEYSGKQATDFWEREDLTQKEALDAIHQRNWLEMAYVLFLSTEISKYWYKFDREIVTQMCKHMQEEAHHYEILSRVLEKHGYVPLTYTAPEFKDWESCFQEALEKDHLSAIAAWNCSETSTVSTHDLVINNCRRIGLNDLARCYEKIKKDEDFHARLGDMIINKYLQTDDEIENALWGVRRIRDVMYGYYKTIYPVPAV